MLNIIFDQNLFTVNTRKIIKFKLTRDKSIKLG